MTRMGKANEKGLEEVARAVLKPVFYETGVSWKVCVVSKCLNRSSRCRDLRHSFTPQHQSHRTFTSIENNYMHAIEAPVC